MEVFLKSRIHTFTRVLNVNTFDSSVFNKVCPIISQDNIVFSLFVLCPSHIFCFHLNRIKPSRLPSVLPSLLPSFLHFLFYHAFHFSSADVDTKIFLQPRLPFYLPPYCQLHHNKITKLNLSPIIFILKLV